MTEIIALSIGVLLGWILGRFSRGAPGDAPESTEPLPTKRRLTRRQRQIMATLPPAPTLPTIDELIADEIADSGISGDGDEDLQLSVKIDVWKRDRAALPCGNSDLVFVIAPGADAAAATAADVHLACNDDDSGS